MADEREDIWSLGFEEPTQNSKKRPKKPRGRQAASTGAKATEEDSLYTPVAAPRARKKTVKTPKSPRRPKWQRRPVRAIGDWTQDYRNITFLDILIPAIKLIGEFFRSLDMILNPARVREIGRGDFSPWPVVTVALITSCGFALAILLGPPDTATQTVVVGVCVVAAIGVLAGIVNLIAMQSGVPSDFLGAVKNLVCASWLSLWSGAIVALPVVFVFLIMITRGVDFAPKTLVALRLLPVVLPAYLFGQYVAGYLDRGYIFGLLAGPVASCVLVASGMVLAAGGDIGGFTNNLHASRSQRPPSSSSVRPDMPGVSSSVPPDRPKVTPRVEKNTTIRPRQRTNQTDGRAFGQLICYRLVTWDNVVNSGIVESVSEPEAQVTVEPGAYASLTGLEQHQFRQALYQTYPDLRRKAVRVTWPSGRLVCSFEGTAPPRDALSIAFAAQAVVSIDRRTHEVVVNEKAWKDLRFEDRNKISLGILSAVRRSAYTVRDSSGHPVTMTQLARLMTGAPPDRSPIASDTGSPDSQDAFRTTTARAFGVILKKDPVTWKDVMASGIVTSFDEETACLKVARKSYGDIEDLEKYQLIQALLSAHPSIKGIEELEFITDTSETAFSCRTPNDGVWNALKRGVLISVNRAQRVVTVDPDRWVELPWKERRMWERNLPLGPPMNRYSLRDTKGNRIDHEAMARKPGRTPKGRAFGTVLSHDPVTWKDVLEYGIVHSFDEEKRELVLVNHKETDLQEIEKQQLKTAFLQAYPAFKSMAEIKVYSQLSCTERHPVPRWSRTSRLAQRSNIDALIRIDRATKEAVVDSARLATIDSREKRRAISRISLMTTATGTDSIVDTDGNPVNLKAH